MNRSCENCTKVIVCTAKQELDDTLLFKYGFLKRLSDSPGILWQAIASKCTQYISSQEGS